MTALHAVCFYTGAVVLSGWVAAMIAALVAGMVDSLRQWRRLGADRRFVQATARPLIHEPTVTDWDTELESLIRNIGGER